MSTLDILPQIFSSIFKAFGLFKSHESIIRSKLYVKPKKSNFRFLVSKHEYRYTLERTFFPDQHSVKFLKVKLE